MIESMPSVDTMSISEWLQGADNRRATRQAVKDQANLRYKIELLKKQQKAAQVKLSALETELGGLES